MKKSVLAALICCSLIYAEEERKMDIPPINPPAGPKVVDWSDFFVTGSYIWWKAQQNGLGYAQSGRTLTNGGTVSRGSERDVDFDFTGGFKLGAGLNFRFDGWDIYANYTWLYPKEYRNSAEQKSETGGLQSQWEISSFDQPTPILLGLTKASAKWKMNFNTVDGEIGRNFFVSPRLTLRPHIGVKGGWIHQAYHIHYHLDPSLNTVSFTNVELEMDQRFSGVGIRAGMNSEWKIGDMWSLFADFAVTEMWGNFDVHRKDESTPTAGDEFISFKSGREFHTLLPVIELDLGLRYTHDFKGGKWRVILQGGWEEQVWFSMNQFMNPGNDREGNLTLHGATAKLSFAY